MRKIEIVSLLLVLAAVGILIVSLQMDYGRLRSWMGMLFFALLILAMDPKLFRKKKQKHNIVDEPEETEEDETDFIELASAMPVRKELLDITETYLTFLDKESDDNYYIHYIGGKADEIYIGWPLVRQSYDELFEGYETLDGLFEAAENEEIEDFCTISAEDFRSVRARYQDSIVNYCVESSPAPVQSEPVNRVGNVLVYIFIAFALLGICVAAAMLPFMQEVDGRTYFGIYFLLSIVLLIAFFYFFSATTWLERRIKWLLGGVQIKVEALDSYTKSYYAKGDDNLITFEYHPREKQMMITKTIQIPLNNITQTIEQHHREIDNWVADKSFIERCYMGVVTPLGVCNFFFTIPKADATKVAMRTLREWVFQPDHDASKVCECFRFDEPEGIFWVRYQNCRVRTVVFVPADGKAEVFDSEVNTLRDHSFSSELKRFYVDFEDYYAPRMKENQRVDLEAFMANLP